MKALYTLKKEPNIHTKRGQHTHKTSSKAKDNVHKMCLSNGSYILSNTSCVLAAEPCIDLIGVVHQTEVYTQRKCTASGVAYGVATISRLLKIIGLFCRI